MFGKSRSSCSYAALAAVLGTFACVAATLFSAPASAACTLASTNGTVTRTVFVDYTQGTRSYNLHVPAGLSGNVPLLVDMHGVGSNAAFQESTSGWSPYADSARFIVAYPAGSTGNVWDVNQGSQDVAFIRKVVADIKANYCVDDQRIYAEGGSLGGLMAQRLACDAEDVFASAMSTISGPPNYFGGSCAISRPVAVAVMSSEDDAVFPLAQSIAARDFWIGLNHCSTTGTADPNPHGANGQVYGGCDGGANVLWRTYAPGNGHAYPTGAALDDLHAKGWSFLLAHPRP